MKHVCLFLIKLYRKYVSPYKPSCCRFNPTCSHYALLAYEKHGFFGGTYLTFGRILRCNPFCNGGNDPVPEKIQFISKKQRNNQENGEL